MKGNRYTVMRGETLIGDFVIKDDYGRRVSHVDAITMILTNLDTNALQPVLTLTLGNGIEPVNGRYRFTVSPEQTRTLPTHVGLEVKVTIGDIVRIAVEKFITMIDNKIKDVT